MIFIHTFRSGKHCRSIKVFYTLEHTLVNRISADGTFGGFGNFAQLDVVEDTGEAEYLIKRLG